MTAPASVGMRGAGKRVLLTHLEGHLAHPLVERLEGGVAHLLLTVAQRKEDLGHGSAQVRLDCLADSRRERAERVQGGEDDGDLVVLEAWPA